MEGLVAATLNDFETGKISRRKLIELLTLAATTASAAGAAKAQNPDPTLKAQLINHFSYTCPDYRVAAEWYAKLLNLEPSGMTDREAVLPLGRKGENPYGVTANDVPLTHLIFRTRDANGPPPRSGPRREAPARAVIDHICFTVAGFNRDQAKGTLAALGVKNIRPLTSNSIHMDDPFGYDVQLSGLDETAFTSGG
jgi:hypothetical protein